MHIDRQVLLKIVTSGSVRFTTTLGSIIFTILMPIYFGLDILGEFTIALSIVLGLTLIPRFGFEKYILRVTGANGSNHAATLKELFVIFYIALILCIVVFFITWTVQLTIGLEVLSTNSFSVLKYCIIPLSINLIFANYLNGRGMQELAPLFEPAAPSAFCAIIFIFVHMGFLTDFISILYAWLFYEYLLLGIVFLYLLKKKLNWSHFLEIKNCFIINFRELANYFFSGISNYVLTLGIFPLMSISLSNAEVGFFRLCERIVSFLNFILIVLNNIFARRYALYWQNEKYEAVHNEYKKSLKLGWLLSLPATLIIFLTSTEILNYLLKGNQAFLEYKWIFNVLLLGAIINIFFGGVLLILNMTKHHRIAKNISIGMTFLGVTIFYILPKIFGLAGAGYAFLLFMFLFNVIGYYFAYLKVFSKAAI